MNVVVDMSRMQYGEAGRGAFGEFCFMGTYDAYCDSMERDICTRLENLGSASQIYPSGDAVEEARLKACAKSVWKRWQIRDKEGVVCALW